MVDIIKVKANSRTAAVAGAIAGVMREHKHVDVQAIGAGAVNQAVKALVAQARAWLPFASAGGVIGCTAESGGGSCSSTAAITLAWLSPPNARRPVSIS